MPRAHPGPALQPARYGGGRADDIPWRNPLVQSGVGCFRRRRGARSHSTRGCRRGGGRPLGPDQIGQRTSHGACISKARIGPRRCRHRRSRSATRCQPVTPPVSPGPSARPKSLAAVGLPSTLRPAHQPHFQQSRPRISLQSRRPARPTVTTRPFPRSPGALAVVSSRQAGRCRRLPLILPFIAFRSVAPVAPRRPPASEADQSPG